MFGLEKIYIALNKKKLQQGSHKLNKISIDTIYEIITRSCWKYGIQYENIFKNINLLDIKIYGNKKAVLLRFHKSRIVFMEDYYSFLNTLERIEVKKAYYISTGVFEESILKCYSRYLQGKTIKLENKYEFLRKQYRLKGKINEIKNLELEFYRYFPS